VKLKIPGWLERHHERMRRVALFLLRTFIIPALLSVVYLLGIGFTRLLLSVMGGNPLYRAREAGWVAEDCGEPNEEKYLRQS
jgi:hypothetical protein